MANSKTLIDNLKAALKSRGVTYRELAGRLKVSEPTVKRDLSRGMFSLQRLDQICDAVGINLEELIHPPAPGAPLTQLSDEQERAIVSRPKLLLVAYLTANDWRFQEIVSTFQRMRCARMLGWTLPNRLLTGSF